jgi:hypothetical protein
MNGNSKHNGQASEDSYGGDSVDDLTIAQAAAVESLAEIRVDGHALKLGARSLEVICDLQLHFPLILRVCTSRPQFALTHSLSRSFAGF